MKCPVCGQWNRASFTHCFKCGAALPDEIPESLSTPAEELKKKLESSLDFAPVKYKENAWGELKEQVDQKDMTAREMKSFSDRIRQGAGRRRQLIEEYKENPGYTRSEPNVVYPESSLDAPPAFQEKAEPAPDYQDSEYESPRADPALVGLVHPRGKRRRRLFGLRRFLNAASIFLLIAAALFAGYRYLFKPLVLDKRLEQAKELYSVSYAINSDAPAHMVKIYGTEGAQIYIKELRKSYLVVDGEAEIIVPDYIWYSEIEEDPLNSATWLPEKMAVQLTPYIRSAAGKQEPMPVIDYEIDIPLSPLTLISPDTTFTQTGAPVYNIQFQVDKTSQVYINDKDYSSYVNAQDGMISYMAEINAIGDNNFTLTVKGQHARMNTKTLVIHRPVQDIELNLAATIGNESDRETMAVSGITRAGATITVLTPHERLDVSRVPTTGEFHFFARFDRYGDNIIRILAQFPGKNDTELQYKVNYLPSASKYTTRAWKIDDGFGYGDLLANLGKRIENSQVYVMTGTVEKEVSTKPQLVIFDASDGKSQTGLRVMLENQTKSSWEVGKRYTIYADAYGMYDSLPRLVARYTYAPKNAQKK